MSDVLLSLPLCVFASGVARAEKEKGRAEKGLPETGVVWEVVLVVDGVLKPCTQRCEAIALARWKIVVVVGCVVVVSWRCRVVSRSRVACVALWTRAGLFHAVCSLVVCSYVGSSTCFEVWAQGGGMGNREP